MPTPADHNEPSGATSTWALLSKPSVLWSNSEFFTTIAVPWIEDPLADQQNGGSIAWAIGELPTLALALIVAVQWARADDAESRRRDRRADRDEDAELTAYNAHLARMGARGGRQRQD